VFALVVVALTTGLTCVVGEVVLRLWAPQKGFYVPDAHCRYVLRAGFNGGGVTINRHGMRDLERDLERDPEGQHGKRVLVVGDSFPFGMGVAQHESFPRALDGLLGQAEVINAGVPGYSNVQMASWLEHYGLAWKPDVLVVSVFVGNDLWENLGSDTYHVVERRLVAKGADQRRQHSERGWFRQLRNKSHFYRLLKRLPRALSKSDRPKAERIYWQHTLERMGVCAVGEAAKSWEPAWELCVQKLTDMRDRVAPAPMVVLAISDEFQLNPAVRAEVRERYPELDESLYDWTAPNRRLAKICAELKVTLVDPLAEMAKRTAAGEAQYLPPLEAHYNASGHGLAAEALAETPELEGLR
jgi:hypothetical protein